MRHSPKTARRVAADQPLLVRVDSGFDSTALLFQLAAFKDALTAQGRSADVLIQWNPRRYCRRSCTALPDRPCPAPDPRLRSPDHRPCARLHRAAGPIARAAAMNPALAKPSRTITNHPERDHAGAGRLGAARPSPGTPHRRLRPPIARRLPAIRASDAARCGSNPPENAPWVPARQAGCELSREGHGFRTAIWSNVTLMPQACLDSVNQPG